MTTVKVYMKDGGTLEFPNVAVTAISATGTVIQFSYPDDVSTTAVKRATFGLYGIAGYEIVTR